MIFNFIIWLFKIYVFYQIVLFFKYFYNKLIRPLFWKQIDYKSYGNWAVITGCTDGIGRAFTFELAKLGMDLILISRTKEKLEALEKELCEKYNIKTKIIVADFKNSYEVMPLIKKELDGIDIGLLINNVGTALPRLIDYVDNKKEKVNDLVEVNIKSAIFMSSIVLDGMIKRRKGVIINIASLLSITPIPGASVYAATKAFILKFSNDLQAEYKKYGIVVHCLTTGPVVTKLFNVKLFDFLTPTPEMYAKSALKRVGMGNITTGYNGHDFIEFIIKALNQISPVMNSMILTKMMSARKKKFSAQIDN